jgi:hypothetical protein
VTTAAVSDAGPLIHLAEIDALHLLSVFDSLLVPKTVYDEIEAGGVPDGLATLSYERVEASLDRNGFPELDAGERSALVVAKTRDAILLTDDREARVAAENLASLVAEGGDGELGPRLSRYTFESPGWLVSVGDGAVAQVGPSVFRGTAATVAKAGVGVGYLATASGVEDAVGLLREEFDMARPQK